MKLFIEEILGAEDLKAPAIAWCRALHTKESRADYLRQVESCLFEAKGAIDTLARLYIYCDLPFDLFKESIDNVVELFRALTLFVDVNHLQSTASKSSVFARAMIDEASRNEPIRALILSKEPLINCGNLDEDRQLWYRLYCLLIPIATRDLIRYGHFEVDVVGFIPRE